jgi:hypothetical protein
MLLITLDLEQAEVRRGQAETEELACKMLQRLALDGVLAAVAGRMLPVAAGGLEHREVPALLL